MNNSKQELTEEILTTSLEIATGVPIINIIAKGIKYVYHKGLVKKFENFLYYAIDINTFYKDIEENENFSNYLTDYFEAIKSTPSIWAIKVMALIFREHKNDKKIQQRTCRVFIGIADDELDFFKYVCKCIEELEEERKNNNSIIPILNIEAIEKNNDNFSKDDIYYYSVNLYNRGFFNLYTPTGLLTDGRDVKTIKLNEASKFYLKYIKLAEQSEYYVAHNHAGSENFKK